MYGNTISKAQRWQYMIWSRHSLVKILQRLRPKAPNIDPEHFRRINSLAQTPKQRPIHPHELLPIDLISLIQNTANLILVALKHVDGGFQLVRDVQLVSVKEQQNQVGPLGKPGHHLGEVVSPIDALFLPRQNPWSVHQGDTAQHRRGQLTPLESTQKAHAEALQPPKGQIGMNAQRVPGNRALLWPVDQAGEPVGSRLGPDPRAWKVPAEHVSNERRLAHAVLAHQHDLGLGVELAVGQEGGFIEVVVAVALFGGQDAVFVDLLELLVDAGGFFRRVHHDRQTIG